MIDLGLGVGKQGIQNFGILDRLIGFSKLGQALMISSFGQRFLTDSVCSSDEEQLVSEAAFSAIAARSGAHIIRTQNVARMVAATRVADLLVEARDASSTD